MASYPTKESSAPSPTGPPSPTSSPPPPLPTPPPPSPSPTDCGDSFSYCPSDETCCCLYELLGYCFGYGCCPYENGVCCTGTSSCCPSDYPICVVEEGLCLKDQGDKLGIAASKGHMAKHKFPWTKLSEKERVTPTGHILQWKRSQLAVMR